MSIFFLFRCIQNIFALLDFNYNKPLELFSLLFLWFASQTETQKRTISNVVSYWVIVVKFKSN